MNSATAEKVAAAAIPLRDIAVISKREYESWINVPGFDFAYQQKGLLEIFQTKEGEDHAHHTLEKAHEVGLSDTRLLSYKELQELELQTKQPGLALLVSRDAHLYPTTNEEPIAFKTTRAVKPNEEAINFEQSGATVVRSTAKNSYEQMRLSQPVHGAGSFFYAGSSCLCSRKRLFRNPGILLINQSSPVLVAPGRLRRWMANDPFGAPWKLLHQTQLKMKRVQGIMDAVNDFSRIDATLRR